MHVGLFNRPFASLKLMSRSLEIAPRLILLISAWSKKKETQIGKFGILQGFALTQNSSCGCLLCSTPLIKGTVNLHYYVEMSSQGVMSSRKAGTNPGLYSVNPLNAELNPICYLLALLAHHFLHVNRIRFKSLTIRLLMSYIYGAPVLDVSRPYTTTRHSR